MTSTNNESIIKRFFVFLMWVIAVWLILWNIFRIWPGEQWWPVAMVNYFAPWFALFLVLLTGIAFLIKRRLLGLCLITALILICIHFIPYFTPLTQETPAVNQLEVMSFNIFQRNAEVQDLIAIITEHDPDIVALQEVTPELGAQIARDLGEQYPHHTLELLGDVMGQGLLSRYPIRQLSPMPDYNYQSALVDTPQGPIRLFNIHSPTLFPFTWRQDWEFQRTFFEHVLDEINKFDGPKIVLGDFNTTPLSELYALITSNLIDTHIESGWGFGFSYPARPKLGIRLPTPVLRIDYIFTSEHFTSYNTQVLKESGDSDHRPVITTLEFIQ